MTHKQIVAICIFAMLLLVAIGTAHAQDKAFGFNDAVITRLVKTAINNDPALRSMNISIETRDRVVHLSGFVDSMADIGKAEVLARAVEGVTAVMNVIRVWNRPSRA
jgi:osmotically-inducible protein OsmY